jgi:hypothetical protein
LYNTLFVPEGISSRKPTCEEGFVELAENEKYPPLQISIEIVPGPFDESHVPVEPVLEVAVKARDGFESVPENPEVFKLSQ